MQGLKQHMTQINQASAAPPAAPSEGEEGGYIRARVTRAPDRRHQRKWVPITTGWLCLLIGLADVISVAVPGLHLHHRLHRITAFVPGTMTNFSRTSTVIIGLVLVMLSHVLRRRKRRALQAGTLLLAFSIVVHVVHAPYRIQGAAAAAVLAVLLFFRDEFYAVRDPRTRWRAAGVFAGLVVADVAIGLTYMLLARHLAEDYSFWQRTVHVVYGLVGVSGPVRFVPDARADLFNLMTSTLGVFTLLVTAYLFLRPAKQAARCSKPDSQRIRGLLDRHGHRDSLGYFALRDDKNVIWSPTGKACVGYRVISGVILAAGDPIGDPEAWPGAMAEFLAEAYRHAWRPAIMGCSELGAEVWSREGNLTALELGDEAI